MTHADKLRWRIGREAADAQVMRDYAAELRAKGQHGLAAKIEKQEAKHEEEAEFLRDRLRNL